jgi:hypothetical protein
MPEEVKNSLLDGPSKMFFLDTLNRDRFLEHSLEDKRGMFPNVYGVMYTLKNRETQHGFSGLHMVYGQDDVENMVTWIASKLSGDKSDFGTRGAKNFQEYIDDILPPIVDAFWEKNPEKDVVRLFTSLNQVQTEDYESEEYCFIQLLRALCGFMSKPKTHLKVIVFFNQSNRLWDKFHSSTQDPDIKKICTAHKFGEKDWSCLWPVQNEEPKQDEAQ